MLLKEPELHYNDCVAIIKRLIHKNGRPECGKTILIWIRKKNQDRNNYPFITRELQMMTSDNNSRKLTMV